MRAFLMGYSWPGQKVLRRVAPRQLYALCDEQEMHVR